MPNLMEAWLVFLSLCRRGISPTREPDENPGHVSSAQERNRMLVDARSVSSVAIARPQKKSNSSREKNNANPQTAVFRRCQPPTCRPRSKALPRTLSISDAERQRGESKEIKHKIRVEMRRQKDQIKAKTESQ